MGKTEKTLVLLKPDALERALAGEILARFERKGLRIAGLKLMKISDSLARKHYRDLMEKPFFPEILAYITRGPVLALVLEGICAISVVRQMVGVTDGAKALPGTVRGDFTLSFRENLVHASDSSESAKREIALFFKPSEMIRKNG